MYRWRGYFSSLRTSPGKLILNLNSTVAPFYKTGPLPELCMAFMDIRDYRDIAHLIDKKLITLSRFLKGLSIKVTEMVDGKSHRFKIKEYSPIRADERSFDMGGRKVTVEVSHLSIESVTADVNIWP